MDRGDGSSSGRGSLPAPRGKPQLKDILALVTFPLLKKDLTKIYMIEFGLVLGFSIKGNLEKLSLKCPSPALSVGPEETPAIYWKSFAHSRFNLFLHIVSVSP